MFSEITCANCGIVFCIEDDYVSILKKEHKTFYCPNGHAQSFVGETEAEKYKRYYENSESKNERCRKHNKKIEHARRFYKGRYKKLKGNK